VPLPYKTPPAAKVVAPVPPNGTVIVEAFHVPVTRVPTFAKLDKVVTAVFTRVPVVGSVTFVAPVVVSVRGFAPDVVRLPPRVIVDDPLFTPVPPYVGEIILPCHVPVVIVPTVAKLGREFSVSSIKLKDAEPTGKLYTVSVVMGVLSAAVKFPSFFHATLELGSMNKVTLFVAGCSISPSADTRGMLRPFASKSALTFMI
jgi:hypothetical protein